MSSIDPAAWMETSTGKKFFFSNPEPAIDIIDIGHALSNICRFNGQSPKFYSVARHTVSMVRYVREKEDNDTEFQKLVLLHDGSEAYLGDMVRPLKMCMPEYRELERSVQNAIYRKWNLSEEYVESQKDRLKVLDNRMLMTEHRHLWENPLPWSMEKEFPPYEDFELVSSEPMTDRAVFYAAARQLLIS